MKRMKTPLHAIPQYMYAQWYFYSITIQKKKRLKRPRCLEWQINIYIVGKKLNRLFCFQLFFQ
jgi:hypothetical protein